MEFYQENKINPLASCIPLLLQLPVFFALYQLLRGDTFKSDVTGCPPPFDTDTFQHCLDATPRAVRLHPQPGRAGHGMPVLGVLIVLFIVTQLAAGMVMMASADRQQRILMFALPLIIRALHHQLPRRPRRLLDLDQRLDARPAVRRQARAAAARSWRRPRGDGESRRRSRRRRRRARRSAASDDDAPRSDAAAHRWSLPEEPPSACARSSSASSSSLDLDAEVEVDEDDAAITARIEGEDLGLLIGRRGQTIDAIQLICLPRRLPRRPGPQAGRASTRPATASASARSSTARPTRRPSARSSAAARSTSSR